MGRVEWSALSGDEVEAVLSNLLYNAYERALRIRPSQGDFGIDVIVPNEEDCQTWDVYQIKKFAQNLTANQKSQVEASFRRVLVALVRRGVPLNSWCLITPLDPTLDNLLDWFSKMPEEASKALAADKDLKLTGAEKKEISAWLTTPGRVIGWKGLDFCQKLAGDYPYVVDYYLHGGRERLREAVAEVAQLLGRDISLRDQDPGRHSTERAAALLQPGELREHLLRLDRVLDTDPHFSYGHSLELNRPDLQPEPNLVAATQESIPGGRWLTFKIYQRSAQSLDERPIPLELEFDFEGSAEDRTAIELWRKYGKPFEATASFKAHLPGGLHGEAAAARVQVSPADGEETQFRNRLRIVAPDGAVLAELAFAMASTTGMDATGAWTHGTDDSGTLATEGLLDATAMSGTINFTVQPLIGIEANTAVAAVTFASHLVSPNLLQVAGAYGDFHDYSPVGSRAPLVPPAVAHVVQALATIQTRTSTPVLVPDVAALSPKELGMIRRAASLIEGRTVVGTWPDIVFDKLPDVELDPFGHYQIAVTEPLIVPLNGQAVVLGGVEHKTLSAAVASIEGNRVRMVPRLNNSVHADFLPEAPNTPEGKQRVRYRQLPDVDPASTDDSRP